MTQKNFTLLATSHTLEGIIKMINKYFYSTTFEIRHNENILTGNKSQFYDVYNSKGKLESFAVIKDRLYRFMQVNK